MGLKEKSDAALRDKNGNTLSLPEEFFYHTIMGLDYMESADIPSINSDVKILAKYSPQNGLDSYRERVKVKDVRLLLSLLSLRDRLPDKLFDSLNYGKIEIHTESDKKAIGKVINWCKKNGFPFPVESVKNPSRPLFPLLESVTISFHITDFLFQLNDICSYFCLYQLIAGHEEKISKPIFLLPTSNNTDSKSPLTQMKIIQPGIVGERTEEFLNYFEQKYRTIYFISYLSKNPNIHFEIETHSLFDAAFYQLALLLRTPKNIRKCRCCENYFIPRRKNQVYCGTPCTPQLAYKKRMAARLKQPNRHI